MHRNIIILLLLGSSLTLNSQNISIIVNGYFQDLDTACNINNNFCPQKQINAFAYHPAGYLVKKKEISVDPPRFDNDSIYFYKYDPLTCSETLLYSFKQYNFSTSRGYLNIDYLGRM